MIHQNLHKLGEKIGTLQSLITSLREENQKLKDALNASEEQNKRLRQENHNAAEKLFAWIDEFRRISNNKGKS